MATNRFKLGSGAYNCRICSKLTRETGYDESSVELCALCYWTAVVENAESDHGKDSYQYKMYAMELENVRKRQQG